MKTIGKYWNSFRTQVIPKTASETQISEMKLAFYAGAHALLQITHIIGHDEVSEDEAMEIITNINEEIDAYFKERIK